MSKIVFTNGCFDLIHRGHIELLRFCKRVGDHVVVGLNSDASLKKLKGPNRPINSEQDRKILLEALECVDEVKIFDEDTPLDLIKKIKPDMIVKGGDYSEDQIVGNDICKVLIFNYVEGYSTSNIIKKINESI